MAVDDLYSILEVSTHATDAEIERAYERLLKLFDPERYPGSTEDAYRRLDEVNAAYAQIRDQATGEARDVDLDVDLDSEVDAGSDAYGEPKPDERHVAIADTLVRLGFISDTPARTSNPAVDVLAALLPEHAEVGVCLSCLGVKFSGPYDCRERTGLFRSITLYRRLLERTEFVLCTQDELLWTVSQHHGRGPDGLEDRVSLYSIPFTEILGAAVHNHKRDVVEVWLDDGETLSVHTRPHQANALCDYIERVATSE